MGCSGCGGDNNVGSKRNKNRYVPGEVTGDGAFVRFTPEELDWILQAFKNAPRPKGGLNEAIFNKVKAGGLKDVGTYAEAGAMWDWIVHTLDGAIDIAEMFGTMSVPNCPKNEISDLATRLSILATRIEDARLERHVRHDAPQVEDGNADGETDEEESGDDQEADR